MAAVVDMVRAMVASPHFVIRDKIVVIPKFTIILAGDGNG